MCLKALEWSDPKADDNLLMDSVKQRYFALAKKYHPDVNALECSEKFVTITKAYERLIELDRESEGRLFKSTKRKELTEEQKEQIRQDYLRLQQEELLRRRRQDEYERRQAELRAEEEKIREV